MKFCKIIINTNAVSNAMRLIKSAHQEIIATMDMGEEIRSPLPKRYHDLLLRKAKEGMTVKRFGFGSSMMYVKLAKKYVGIKFFYGGRVSSYQRMLIVDQKRAMFGVGGLIFYTDFPPLVDSLVKYIIIIYNKEDL